MTGASEVSEAGEPVTYDGEVRSPERPLVPIVYGDSDGRAAVAAARRVLDAAAEMVGREVEWVDLPVGKAGRDGERTAPDTAVRTLRRLRVALLGPPDAETADVYRTLRRRLDLHATVTVAAPLPGAGQPMGNAPETDVVLFREATEDVAAGIEFGPGTAGADRLQQFLEAEGEDAASAGETGIGVRPVSRPGTERIVETAVEYALDADRDRVTVAHQGNLTPATDASFRDWALAHLDAEYGDATVSDAAFRADHGGVYPEDELVVGARDADGLCRELLTDPGGHDVVVAPALAGAYLSTVLSAVGGGIGVTPTAALGAGRMLAGPMDGPTARDGEDAPAPIATVRSGCLLFEYIGWDDAAAVARDALRATVAGGVVPRGTAGRVGGVTTAAFTERVVERIVRTVERSLSGAPHTTPEERRTIKRLIASLHDAVFDDRLSADDIELTDLRDETAEAEIYLPEVGINVRYWRRWSVERRIEVLLHELAHVENYADDHAPTFYDRLVELTEIAADHRPELEVSFGEPIDFDRVKRHVVESVHEETIEPDMETVAERQRRLREAFGLGDAEHY
jgi:isocitrate dehydrogenase